MGSVSDTTAVVGSVSHEHREGLILNDTMPVLGRSEFFKRTFS